jgi:hypothetical protein
MRDHRVVSGQRPDFDLDLLPLPPPGTLTVELGLMRRVGERQPASERAAVPARELAGVKHHRHHLGLRDALLSQLEER